MVQDLGVLLTFMLWLCRLDAPFGTPEAPVQVPSSFSHRVVGVPGESLALCSGLPECPQQLSPATLTDPGWQPSFTSSDAII